MKALRKWIEENRDIASVLVVSSGMHLKRLRVCAQALFARKINLRFCAAPIGFKAGIHKGAGEAETPSWSPVLLECLKLVIYSTILSIRLSGLRRFMGLGQP